MKLVPLAALTFFLILGCSHKTDPQPPHTTELDTHSTDPSKADRIYFNGKIITINDAQPEAEAVAVKNGAIIYVGDLNGAKPFIDVSTEQIDLANHTMVPGFVDAHGHVVNAGLQAASANLLAAPDGPVNSFAQLVDTLSRWASSVGAKTLRKIPAG